MTFCTRLKEARTGAGMTQEKLASELGIAKSTLSGYENGVAEPSINMVARIIKVLGIDANYLWQDSADFTMKASFFEIRMVEKYRNLDEHGKKIVDFVLHEEAARVEGQSEGR